MFKTAIGFAVVVLGLAAAAFQSASANYAPCTENPDAPGCPMARAHESTLLPAQPKHVIHAHNYRAPRPAPRG